MLKHPIYNPANLLTSLNLLSGCLAIVCMFQAMFEPVLYFVLFSMLMDFFDGLVARKLGTGGLVGKDLDSLADIISFGFLPAVMIYQMFFYSENGTFDTFQFLLGKNASILYLFLNIIPFILVIFSALRLAKFNNDPRQSNEFYGLNTPTSCLFVLGIFQTWLNNDYNIREIFSSHWYFMVILVVFLSILMMSDIPMFSFKLKGFNLKTNWNLPTLFVFATIALFLFGYIGISISVIGYIFISLIYNKTSKTI